MANVIPQGELYFYSGIHTGRPMLFSSKNNRDSYFAAHISNAIGGNDYTVIKKQTNKVRVQLNSANPGQYNYLSFRNPNFEDLIYYCRILDYYWINQECCEYTYAIDIWLTYCFDVGYNQCFIERESLSEIEYTAATNDATAFNVRKMRTDEPLAVGEELQKDIYSSNELVEALNTEYSSASGKFINVIFVSPTSFDSDEENIDGKNYNKYQWLHDFYTYIGGGTPSVVPSSEFKSPGIGGYHNSENGNYFHTNSSLTGYLDGNYLVNKVAIPCDICIIEEPDCIQQLLDQLTIWNAVSAIVAIYTMPLTMLCACFRNNYSLGTLIQIDRMSIDTNTSPKLAMFPYSYVLVTAPDGNQKEYHFEYFQNRTNGKADFYLTGALNGIPKINLIPASYKKVFAGTKEDYTESMCYQGFPQVPYCTDSFLAYMASACTDLMRSNTEKNKFGMDVNAELLRQQEHAGNLDISTGIAGTSGAVGWAKQILGNVADIGRSFLGKDPKGSAASIQSLQLAQQQETLSSEREIIQDSYKLSLNNLENNSVATNLASTRPSFVTADYHKTSDGGYEIFDNFNICDFIIARVELREEVKYAYSAFFKEFGYTLNMKALPIVSNYVHGDSSIIHWDDNLTYIKTRDMHIDANLRPVQDFIEAMFNGGTQFIRGESLS